MINIIEKTLHIREITNSDLPILCVWRNSDDFIKFCTKRKSKISFIDFGYEINKDLKGDRLVQVVVLMNNIPIGTLYAYRFDKINKTIYITTYFLPEYRKNIFIIKSLVLFITYLFEIFNISKLYVEVYSYNKRVMSMLMKIGFKYEDYMRRSNLETKEEYGLHIYYLPKEDLENLKIKSLIKRLA